MQEESKEDVEEEIKSTTESYLEHILENENNSELPTELNGIDCTIYSSSSELKSGKYSGRLMSEAIKLIRDVIKQSNDQNPILMKLKLIPQNLEVKRYREKVKDCHQKSIRSMDLIRRQSNKLKKHPYINKVPPLKKVLDNFLELLEPLVKIMDDIYNEFMTSENLDKLREEHDVIYNLLTETDDWLRNIEKKAKLFSGLFKDIDLDIFIYKELESRAPSQEEKSAKVFILEMKWNKDELMTKIKSSLGRTEETNTPTIPDFAIKENYKVFMNKLRDFNKEANSEQKKGGSDTTLDWYW